MLSSLISTLQGSPWLWIFVLLASPFLGTWLLSNVNARRSRNGEPPLIPYTVPWLGHGFFVAKDITGFGTWARKRYPHQDVLTAVVAGTHMYIVFDPKLAAIIYRRPKYFTFDPLALLSAKVFGAPQHDLDIIAIGTHGVARAPGYQDDGRRVHFDLHQLFPMLLEGPNLATMISKFMNALTADLNNEFPKDQDASGEWVTLDICDFVKKRMTLASITSLFGSHLRKIWPRIYEDFWEFDEVVQLLLLDLPHVLLPTAAARRKKMLNRLLHWREEACKHKSFEEIQEEDPDWDKYWGARLVRMSHSVLLKNGISVEGQEVFSLGILWGQNSNAIPVGIWMVVQSILDSDLHRRIRSEVLPHRNSDGTFDMNGLVTNTLLKSMFLEALRFSVASPSLRVVMETTQVSNYTFHKGSRVLIPGRELQMEKRVWSPNNEVPDALEFWAERFLDMDKGDNGDAERAAEAREANAQYADTDILKTKTKTAGTADRRRPKTSTDAISLPSSTTSKTIRDRMLSLRPFGGGVTLCPGRHVAMYKEIATLAILLSHFEIEVDEKALGTTGRPQPRTCTVGAMAPDRKLIVRMRRR
ncbi:hypothetical protein AJ79_08608 [Helicocarpus griseus UAMH5409]|uniref:Cytochrome P450 n=1 Tax=Helicocarpus griseus UAMH5409 TaxID=1447875 RepID=A0A2B7WS14_9EURO|nr:hypothetical protein AJ79_08608 [Helicocarpus griseus UAMH5409]